MMRYLLSGLGLLIFSLLTNQGFAQILMDPSTTTKQGRSRLGFGLSLAELDYDTGSSTPEFKRKTVGVVFDHGIASKVDITGQLGYIMDLEVESNHEDGKGFVLGFGVRGLLHSTNQLRVYGYGFFAYQKEDINYSSGGKMDITTYDFHLGSVIGFPLSSKIQPYFGLDLVAINDGDVEAKSGSVSVKSDIERDDIVNIKLGLSAFFDAIILRPELTLFGEQTFVFSASFLL